MATLSEEIALCTCLNEKDLLSLTLDGVDGNVIATTKTKSIQIFKLSDQKLVCSWSLRKGIQVTSPVVWYQNEYITIVNHQDLRMWKKEEINFEKATRKHFKFNISEVLVEKGWEPVVLCKNGMVDYLDAIKQSYAPSEEEKNILSCDIFTVDQCLCVTRIVKEKGGEIYAYHSWIHKNSSSWRLNCSLLLDSESSPTFVDSYFCATNTCVRVFLLCSNGNLTCSDLSERNEEAIAVSQNTISGVQTGAAMTVLSSTHVAIAGLAHEGKVGIGIFDSHFGSLQVWKPLPAKPQTKKYNLFSCYDQLLTACGGSLYMYQYTCTNSTVASVLGCLQSSSQSLTSPVSAPVLVNWGQLTDNPKCASEAVDSSIPGEMKRFLTNLNKKSGANTDKEIEKFVSHMKEELHWMGSMEYQEFLRTCFTQKSVWHTSLITQLVTNKIIPNSLLTTLVHAIIEHRDTVLLYKTLKAYTDLPEQALCDCLQYIFSLEESALVSCIQQLELSFPVVPEDSGCLQCARQALFLNKILRCPINDVYLVDHIRSLSFSTVLKFISFLLHCLSCNEEHPSDTSPSIDQIIDWLSLVLDGHVTQLIISPDAAHVLAELHQVVTEYMQFHDELGDLEALLNEFKVKSRRMQSKQRDVGKYCIEYLTIF